MVFLVESDDVLAGGEIGHEDVAEGLESLFLLGFVSQLADVEGLV